MPSAAETLQQPGILGAPAREGLETLDQNQQVTFTKYLRVVLPLDGFVFWVRSSILSPSSQIGAAAIAAANIAGGDVPAYSAADTMVVQGSLHYGTRAQQTEEANYTLSSVTFTSETEVNDLRAVSPSLIYVGEFEGLRFTFSERREFYKQADLYHYTGTALTAVMAAQFIESPETLDTGSLVVSNSLPLWLAMDLTNPPPGGPPPASALPLFPAYLVPVNQPPPYGAVYINPRTQTAMQPTPYLDILNTHYQLVSDEVEVTLYGARNNLAIDFLDYVNYVSYFNADFGIMDAATIVHDEHLTQPETQTLAQKKKLTFRINYYQTRVRDVVRQLISEAFVTQNFGGNRDILIADVGLADVAIAG